MPLKTETMKIEKLELKHLAPYLPYKLGMIDLYYFDSDDIPWVRWVLSSLSVNDEKNSSIDEWWNEEGDNFYIETGSFKPILRPLSDLELDIYKTSIFNREYIIDKDTDADLNYYEWCFLFENHFDVFGLIESGLAVDINTLNK